MHAIDFVPGDEPVLPVKLNSFESCVEEHGFCAPVPHVVYRRLQERASDLPPPSFPADNKVSQHSRSSVGDRCGKSQALLVLEHETALGVESQHHFQLSGCVEPPLLHCECCGEINV